MIVLLGTYPPPIGGVSMHIKRLKGRLDAEGLPNQVWNTGGRASTVAGVLPIRVKYLPLRYACRRDVDILHVHLNSPKVNKYLGFFNRILFPRRIKMLTVHGEANFLFSGEHDSAIWAALNTYQMILCTRPGDSQILAQRGVRAPAQDVPPFIPPVVDADDVKQVPQHAWQFVADHQPVLTANAWRIGFHNGSDLYGIDMCVELLARLRKDLPRAGLVFCLPEIGDADYFARLQARVADLGIQAHFLFITRPCPLYPIIMQSQVFLRPTNTDGDALSVREALHFGVPAVVSDAVPRPAGAVLFKTRDLDDLERRTRQVLADYPRWKAQIPALEADHAGTILKIYRRLAQGTITQ